MKKEKKIRGLPWTKSTISTLEILVDKIKRKLILIPYCLQFNTEKKVSNALDGKRLSLNSPFHDTFDK